MTRSTAAFGVAVVAAFALRIVWPLADPPATLSWSSGVLTDPAAVVHAARSAVITGEWVASRDLLFYPLMNGLTWAVFSVFDATRLSTQWLAALLSTAAVVGFALSLGRTHGRRAGAAGAVVLGTSFWLGMFGRVALVENLTAALLALATWLAVGGRRGYVPAAGVAAVAVFFGKAHAVPFGVALLVFVAWREGSLRALRGPAVAVGGVAALWVVAIFVPFRAEIMDQLREISAASLPGSPWLAPLTTIRTSWLFHRMPIVSAVGALFLLQTFLLSAHRRARLANGSALFPLVFASFWIYSSALPYQAPRYYVVAAYAFVAGAVAWGIEAWNGSGQGARNDGAGGGLGAAVLAFLLPFLVGLGFLEGLIHAATAWDGWTRVHSALPSPVAERVLAFLHPFGRNALLAVALAGVVAALLRTKGSALRNRIGPRTVGAGGVAVLAIALTQWGTWASHRSETLEDAKRSFAAIVPETASIYGAFAPAVTLGGPWRAVPAFGPESADGWAGSGTSHLVLESPAGNALAARLAAEGAGAPVELARWELAHRHVQDLRLLARQGPGFPGTSYERAALALAGGSAADAVRVLEDGARPDVPDLLVLEAQARFLAGDRDGARDCLERAVRIRPSARELFHLGELAKDAGDSVRARECWRAALALRPGNADVAEALRRIGP